MSVWKVYKLEDVAYLQTGFPFKGDRYEMKGNLKVVRGENVTLGTLRWDSEKHWNHSTTDLEKYFLKEGDIVIGMDGSRVGKNRAIIREEELPLILAQRVARLRAKKEFDQKYIWYNIYNDKFQNYVEAINTGTSIPHISPSQINDFEITAPALPEQKRISEVLSSIDDKIDLLHRQNKTLEALAETLFRQWFVEEAVDSWDEKSLFDLIEIVGGGTPKTEIAKYWDGNIKWISARDITPNHKGIIIETEKSISELGLKNSSTKLLPKYSTVISARGTVGKYCLLSEDMAFSQSNYGIIPKYKNCFFFNYLLIAYSVEELQAAAYGTVFDTITTNTFKEHKLKLPSETEIRKFEKTVSPYFEKLISNNIQIRTLTKLRDTLLPKLMSGEVRVKN